MSRRPIRELLADALIALDPLTNAGLMAEIHAVIDSPVWLPMETAPRDWQKPILAHCGDGKPAQPIYWFIDSWFFYNRGAGRGRECNPVGWIHAPKVPNPAPPPMVASEQLEEVAA